jgi:hypothetical protein
MTRVVAIMSMSLDGYVADANDGSPKFSTGTSRATSRSPQQAPQRALRSTSRRRAPTT